jgi:hypothetical protein
MSTTLLERPARQGPACPVAPRRKTRVIAPGEARWALAALVLFAIALPLQLAGVSAWVWGPLYALCYTAGGWEPGLAGLTALRAKPSTSTC